MKITFIVGALKVFSAVPTLTKIEVRKGLSNIVDVTVQT